MKGKKTTKLNDYMSQHQSLLADFNGTNSTHQKYSIIKKTINILNTLTIQPPSSKEATANDVQLSEHQSEQVYLRQLSKMYEGQELFQLYKSQKFASATRKNSFNSNVTKKPSLSAHHFVKKSHCNRQEQNFVKSKEKPMVLPNFEQILQGCSVGFSGKCTQAIIKHKIKRTQKSILKPNKQKKESIFTNAISKKNINMKQQISLLKKKAKNLYELDFDVARTEPNFQDFQQQNKQNIKQECLSLHFYRPVPQQKEQQKKKHKTLENGSSQQNFENFTVPYEMLLRRPKFRPVSVCFKHFRKGPSLIKNTHYFKI